MPKTREKSDGEKISGCIFQCIVVLTIDVLIALVLQEVWNWLVPSFHGPSASFGEAFALVVLINFVINGLRRK